MPTLMQGNNPIGVINKSGGGGHIIQDASGTDMAQQPNMQFTDAHVSDDPTNDKTEVEVIKSVASADYSSETEDGLYLIPDGDGSVIEPASEDYVEVTADGTKTRATLLGEIYTAMDITKLTLESKLDFDGDIFSLTALGTNVVRFSSNSITDSSQQRIEHILLKNNDCQDYRCASTSSGNTITSVASAQPSNGTIITLYYGNKKAVVDLQTTANRCLRPNGDTVEQWLPKSAEITATTDSGGNVSIGASTVEIIFARFKTNSGSPRICTTFYGNGATYINVKDLSGNNIVNTSVTIKYYYI